MATMVDEYGVTVDAPEFDLSMDTSGLAPEISNDDFYRLVGIDPESDERYSNLDQGDRLALLEIASGNSGVLSAISGIGEKGLGVLKNLFKKSDGTTDWGKVAGAAGAIYGAYRSANPDNQQPKGYQGKIPDYTAVRQQVPQSYDPNRRPGSSGQRYFTDTQYVKPGATAEGLDNLVAAKQASDTQAQGLATLNAQNPARQVVPVPAPPPTTLPAEPPVQPLAAGGIAGMAKGRYLRGQSDGMADKIPARIGGGQEARLSHGEFVIPADVVSHLGNGNSDAGAQRLYDMMDRIRKARTGSTKQGKQINPDKFTPV